MKEMITKERRRTFDTYSKDFEKSIKKVVLKNLIESAKEKGILNEIMAKEIIKDIEKMEE